MTFSQTRRASSIASCLLTFLISILLHSVTAHADQIKNVQGVFPRIGQRGTTVEVTIVGVSIHDPREIIFYKPGIRAFNLKTPKTKPPTRGLLHGGRIEEAVVCQFEIAPDCSLGEHPFRLLTGTEQTCIATFHVSPFAVIDENEDTAHGNDSLQTAQSVTPNVTIRGQMGPWANGDVDYYRVQTKAGQRLSVEVDSARLADVHYGDSEFDLAVRILDKSGHVLAANDDNSLHVQDPMLSVMLSRGDVAFVEVKRSIFAPNQTTYCIHIGTNRQPLVAFPPGGQAGTEQTFRMIGDPSGSFEETLAVPQIEGTFGYFGEAPSPVSLRSSPFPNVLEDVDAVETPVGRLPAALNGIIDSRNDKDSFRLSVKKGERLHIRLFAAALGSPIDAAIGIRSIGEEGKPGSEFWGREDASLPDRDIFGTSYRGGGGQKDILDPSGIWEPKADGDYLLEVSDRSGSGGPTGVYRVEIESPRTVAQTLLRSRTVDWTESTRVTGLAVPRGNRWTVNFSLPRGQWNSVQGEFDLVAHGLPDGVRLISPRLDAGKTKWPVQLVAESSAKLGGALFTLEAKPVDSSLKVESRSQQNVPFINHPGGDAWRAVQVNGYIVSVTDPAPFSLEIEPPEVALVRGGELSIPVRILRQKGFAEPVEFVAGFVTSGINTQPSTTIPAEETEGILRLSAGSSTPLGTTPLVVTGSTINPSIDPYLGAGHIRVSSKIVDLTVSDPYVKLIALAQSVRRGEQKTFVWKVQQKSPFEGPARVRLLGLPNGVSVVEPFPVITKDSQEFAFNMEVTHEALLGQLKELSCEVMVIVQDQEITQRAGKGSLRIDPAL